MRKIGNVFVMVMVIAIVFTSCKKDPPEVSFTYSPETIVQYDVVQFTSTSTGATSYSWDFGNGSFTSVEANPSVQFLTSGEIVVKLTATNDDGSSTTEQTITVNAPDNHYMLGETKHIISTDMYWYLAAHEGATPELRLLTEITGQDNPDLLKIKLNMGTHELPGTYSWVSTSMMGASAGVDEFDFGYSANYIVEGASATYDWTTDANTAGGNLVITEMTEGVYKIEGQVTLNKGNWNWSTFMFESTGTVTLSLYYIGEITPLAK